MSARLRFGAFELDPEGYELRRAGAPVHLEPRVFELLAYLVAHRDRVVPKPELLERVWRGQIVSESALTGSIRDLRRALGESGEKAGSIRTVHGRGFQFVAAVDEAPAPSAAPAPVPARGVRTLAVLPLEDVSGTPASDYFADGMTDALISELARIRSLRVISRTSAMCFKGVRKPLGAIAAELGVEYVVEGTVLWAGERVRITPRLVRAAGEETVWAGRYERRSEDVLSLEAEVAEAVAREIDVTLTPVESQRLGARRQVDPEVFLLDLEGRHFLGIRTEDGFRRALRCFQRALKLDPTFAAAHAGLAEGYVMLGNYGIAAPAEVQAPARIAAERALMLDPGNAEARRTLATLKWIFDFDWGAAEAEYRVAAELGPHSATVPYWFGVCLGVQGRFEEARAEHERAHALDPLALNVVAIMGWMLHFARRHRDAQPYFRRVLEVDPEHLMARWFLGEALTELGEWDAALGELAAALALAGGSARLVGYLGYAQGRAGRRAAAAASLAELERRRAAGYVPPYFLALVHAGTGATARALAELDRAWEVRDSMLRDLRVDPPWDSLRAEPRFEDLLRRLGLLAPGGEPARPPRERSS